MAVAFDAAAESHTGTTDATSVASWTWTHTPVGTPRGIVVFTINRNTSNDIVTSVDYGGVAMTAVSSGFANDTAGEVGACKAWFLGSGIPTGAQTITANRTNNVNGTYGVSFSVTAAADTVIDGVASQSEDATTGTLSVTSTATALRFAAAMFGGSNPPAAATGCTLGPDIDFGTRVHSSARENSAGSGARSVGWATQTLDDVAAVAVGVAESAAAATSLIYSRRAMRSRVIR